MIEGRQAGSPHRTHIPRMAATQIIERMATIEGCVDLRHLPA